ncbi:MAG: DUF115 domain-containing protein [Thermoplasmatales archaeon]|nr:MAG: DUF115 domain-containing protein [Thermoplasmatales archaeon]
MHYKKWQYIYEKILRDFGFKLEDDQKASNILSKLLKKEKNVFPIKKLEKLIDNKTLVVFGAGPSLEESIVRHKKRISGMFKIAADGATSALLENDMLPDIIVTDLDGKIRDQLKANFEGSLIVVHAHGDNVDRIKKYIPKLKGNLMGTIQTNPDSYDNVHNFGGFTDGDRAVYLADHFNAKEINLIGFNFFDVIGKYSFAKKKDIELKLKKLKWCKYLLGLLDNNNNNLRYL